MVLNEPTMLALIIIYRLVPMLRPPKGGITSYNPYAVEHILCEPHII